MPSENISLDAVALRTRIKHHFQRALERTASQGISYPELADVITADSELKRANPDLVALVSLSLSGGRMGLTKCMSAQSGRVP